MNGVNKAIILGHVGADPRVAEFQNGGKCAQFTVATTERAYRTKDGHEVPEKTEWHNIVCRGPLAMVAQNYVRRGCAVYIEGKIRTRTYEKDGATRYVTEINADAMQLLDRKPEGAQRPEAAPPPPHPRQQVRQQTEWRPPVQPAKEDDLPF